VPPSASSTRKAGEWLATGRTYSEQHYSPLDAIDVANVERLGLAWEADLESPRFGIEATPVVADGVLYVSSSWGRVFALDATSGRWLWSFDPQIPGAWLRNGCCKPVNRGAAVLIGNGGADCGVRGYFSAYDASNGKLLKEILVGTDIVAAPISYAVGDVQYLAVAAG
jgi:glucose dehydrogenase